MFKFGKSDKDIDKASAELVDKIKKMTREEFQEYADKLFDADDYDEFYKLWSERKFVDHFFLSKSYRDKISKFLVKKFDGIDIIEILRNSIISNKTKEKAGYIFSGTNNFEIFYKFGYSGTSVKVYYMFMDNKIDVFSLRYNEENIIQSFLLFDIKLFTLFVREVIDFSDKQLENGKTLRKNMIKTINKRKKELKS